MVDASQVIPYKRFVESLSDRTRLFSSEVADSLCIYSNQRNITKIEVQQGTSNKSPNTIGFYALYGAVTLKKLTYLMLVTKANLASQILQRKILQVEEIKFLSLSPNAKLNEIHDDDKLLIEMILQIIKSKTLYFSHEYDLTNSFDKGMANQSQFPNPQFTADNLNYYKIPCEKFAYNWPHIKFLSQLKENALGLMQYWQTTFISGCVFICYCRLTQQADCYFILISRREILRSGKRFTQRGCDQDGNCTNFAETEQIIILDKKDSFAIYSYVQTRGSMPFSWQQPATLKWSPKATIQGDRNYNQELCKKHFQIQTKLYPNQIVVNLIDKKGTQKMLGEYFTNLISALKNQNIKYIWFDFHHECRNMKYENLSKLLADMKEELKKGGYFYGEVLKSNVNQLSKVYMQQTGTVRTNCMDCLDRTNVVQGVVARYVLLHILHDQKIIPSLTGEAFQTLPNDLEKNFREFWTRNADIMSLLYSGTGALKTDFTRTGKRTLMGAVNDGRNSLQRYYINNFQDAYNQDCIDLLLGKLDTTEVKVKKAKTSGVISLIITILFILILTVSYLPLLIFDRESEFHQSCIIQIMLLLLGLFICTKVLVKINKFYVPKPILEQ